ncbi:hypothetical protein AKJ16_DCAP12686, partial [Drosera capensis]
MMIQVFSSLSLHEARLSCSVDSMASLKLKASIGWLYRSTASEAVVQGRIKVFCLHNVNGPKLMRILELRYCKTFDLFLETRFQDKSLIWAQELSEVFLTHHQVNNLLRTVSLNPINGGCGGCGGGVFEAVRGEDYGAFQEKEGGGGGPEDEAFLRRLLSTMSSPSAMVSVLLAS